MDSQPLIIATPTESIDLYPLPPLLSSFQTQWQRIALAYTHQNKHELPEVNIPWHGIAIFTTPGISEWKIGNVTKVDSIVPGDTMLVPANEGHSTRWQSEANLDRDLGLADLAKIANLSPHYFTRLFKQSTGFTPHQFVIRCRVNRAKSLLIKGKDSIADIAQQVGFANQAHLNMHLKRLLGITPNMIIKQRINL